MNARFRRRFERAEASRAERISGVAASRRRPTSEPTTNETRRASMATLGAAEAFDKVCWLLDVVVIARSSSMASAAQATSATTLQFWPNLGRLSWQSELTAELTAELTC